MYLITSLSRLFMNNKEYRLSLYPRLGKHWYTYPICFTHHLFKLLFTKTPKAIKLLFTGNKKTKEQKEFVKKMGF